MCRQPAADGQYGGGDEEEGCQRLAEQQERQGGADEGGQGVVGAGAGGADGALGVGVAVDAQAVGHKAEQQQDGDVFGQRDAQRPEAGAEAFDGNYLHRVAVGNLARAVVLQAPADGGAEHQQRPPGEVERLAHRAAVERQQDAGHRNQPDGRPQSAAHRLAEEEQGNEGVATISKLFSSAVLAARQSRRPYIISIDAVMSSTTIAAAKGRSLRASRCSVCGLRLIRLPSIIAPILMPAPR